MIKRTALNRLLGGKLVKPVSSVAKSANQMLDTEHEYLTYLRNRKKFFFMTQVQQTRVVLGKKGKGHEDKSKWGGGGGVPFMRLPRRKKPTKQQLRQRQKSNRVGRFMRNRKAQGIRAGRKVRGLGKAANNIRRTGQGVGTGVKNAPGRVVAGTKNAAGKVAGSVQRGTTALMPKATNVKPATLPKVSLPKPKLNLPKVNLPKGAMPKVGPRGGLLGVAFAGLEFGGRKAQGQSNVQAGVGTAASVGGGLAGAKGGGALGAAIGTMLFPGVGTAVGAALGGIIGGVAGSMVAAGAADAITGANKPQQPEEKPEEKTNKTSSRVTGRFDMATGQGYINGNPVPLEEYEAFANMSSQEKVARYGKTEQKMAEGGVVKSPTRALIGEGGEPEVVLPQSKLGEGYQNMLKSTGGMLVGFASNFLNTIPVGGAAIGALRGEVSRLKGVFGGFANVGAAKIFSGGKVPDMMSKIGSTLTGLVGGAMNMVMGPAYAGPMMPPPPTTAPPAISGSATAGTSGQWGPLLDLIAGKESGGNYEAMYPSTTMPGMTQMTITQVINKATGAVGKYQQLPRFLAERARRAGLDPDKDLFSPANQDKIILEVNIKGNRQGDDWLAGKITDEQFMQGLSQEFASMPNAQGKFYYPGQSSAMTPGQVMDALRRVKNAPKGIQGPTGTNKTMTPGSAGVTSGDLTPASITGAGETNGGMISGFPITSPYGPRVHPVTGEVGKLHGGIDVGTPTGTPLALNAPGEILAAGNYGGYGFMQDVWIPSHNIQLRLAHLSEFVKRSGEFAAGEVISKTGGAAGTPGAGTSSGPHLHFEADTRKNSGAYGGSGNPAAYAKLIALGSGSSSTPTDEKGGGVTPVNKSKDLTPTAGAGKSPAMIPIPMPVPQAQPMPVQVQVPVPEPQKSKHKSYGINPFSGRYEVL